MPLRHSATVAAFAAVIIGGLGAVAPIARADHQPVIVVPGRLDVPVIIDGIDARGAVVTGDWGLYRPGSAPTVEPGPFLIPMPPPVRGYFPMTGRPPRYGRLEVEPGPARRLPVPAQSFYRSWSSDSWPLAVTAYPPVDPPPIIAAPRMNRLKPRAPPTPPGSK